MEKPLSLDDIRVLLELLEKHEVSEFKLERAEEKIFLRRGASEAEQGAAQAPHIQQIFGSLAGTAPAMSPETAKAFADSSAVQMQTPAITPEQAGKEPETTSSESAAAKKKLAEVTSPMVGTFYRRPAVDADPYVEVGDMVKKGNVLCIVEAMKLMNEIESDYTGRIVEICLDDGQMVEYGEPLFRIEVV